MQNKIKMTPSFLRQQTIGVDDLIDTPYGRKPMVYCDYTASGRSLEFVESYVLKLQRSYANTHTEDDYSGRCMTVLMHEAESLIKQSLNAGQDGRLISVGTGATGAISRLQQMMGVYLPPATRQLLKELALKSLSDKDSEAMFASIKSKLPVVFVGPYEHHSNEVSWREGLAEVVEVELDSDGHIDLAHLETLLKIPKYHGRVRIGAFSAASNVTGLISDVSAIAKLLHQNDALACFDYAASAPYVEIDMNPADADARMDAVFISPHKFIGGPGSAGILVFRGSIYNSELAPTHAGGGTVDYVGRLQHDFISDVEERERSGTPGVLQVIRAALAFGIKSEIGVDAIENIEQTYLKRSFDRWKLCDEIEILGDDNPQNRVGIISFNVKDPWGGVIHPRLVTVLLNDLFGIQSRAGCSCAGPYGHRLLNIDEGQSNEYRQAVKDGFHGVKPGWCRLGWHYSMDTLEVDYVIDAVLFLAKYGVRFLPEYHFDMSTSVWIHKNGQPDISGLCIKSASSARFNDAIYPSLSLLERTNAYDVVMRENIEKAKTLSLPQADSFTAFPEKIAHLQFFSFISNR